MLHTKAAFATAALFLAVSAPNSQVAFAQEADGYAIDDPTVVAACSRCHVQDEEGRLSRLSWLRKTPEGWQRSLLRMTALHGVSVSPDDARAIVRYLANEHGLAPEELRPGLFEVERRMDDYDYPGDSGVEFTCIQCHSMGRIVTQRRAEEEWALLLATHRSLYPLVDFQAFRLASGGGDDDDERHPMDVAIDHLTEVFPVQTPEWSAWSANKRSPRLAGTWALSGHEPGKGPIYGQVTITADPTDPDAFTTGASYVYAESGEGVERAGQALVYTGYQWRGRSNPDQDSELREVMFVERDLQTIFGRWFTGDYDEFGPDVTLTRVGSAPVVSGVHPPALVRGTTTAVTLYGANLEAVGGDLDLGEGVTVESVERRGAEAVSVRLQVAADARIGQRDLHAGGSTLAGAVAVHDGIDRIEITPLTGMARTGGANFPKGYQTFEAIGYDDGPDGEPNTEDDLSLGRADVTWRLEEYAATFGDDDIDFVGQIRQDGTFVPAPDGANPARSGNRNNIGDVWVVATHRDPAGEELTARAHLVVTIPLYMRFDPWPTSGDVRTPVGDDGP
jgi:quinohemoprotein amine dehydrogenase